LRERIRLTGALRDVRSIGDAGAETLDLVLSRERERAFAAGVAEGRRLEREGACARLDDAVERIRADRDQAEKELGEIAIELALATTRALLLRELAAGNYDLERLVRETLAEANVGRNPCVVHVHPKDHALLGDMTFRSGTTIQADEGVPPGDVHVETALGLLVRETVGSLEEIRRRLREELA